jgi:hypothetical protein
MAVTTTKKHPKPKKTPHIIVLISMVKFLNPISPFLYI